MALKVRRLGLWVGPSGSCCNFSLTGGPLRGNGTPLNYPLKLQENPSGGCSGYWNQAHLPKLRRPRSTGSLLRDADEGAVRAKEARDDADETEDTEGGESSDEEEEAEEEIKEVALDDEAIADPDLVEDEEAEDADDKPEVVGDEVDLEEIEDDEDGDDEEDDTLIENVDDEDDVGDIIDKGDLDKE